MQNRRYNKLEMLIKVKCSSEDPVSCQDIEKTLIRRGVRMVRPKKAEYFEHYGILDIPSYVDAFNLAEDIEVKARGRIAKVSVHPVETLNHVAKTDSHAHASLFCRLRSLLRPIL